MSGADQLDRLRFVLLTPTLISWALLVLSVPELAIFNHEAAVMWVAAALPCAALQIYIAPRLATAAAPTAAAAKAGVEPPRMATGAEGGRTRARNCALAKVQLLGTAAFLWVCCLEHCMSIQSYSGMGAATVIVCVIAGFEPLLWAAQRKRAHGLHGGAAGGAVVLDDVENACRHIGAYLLFIFFNVFEACGCVALAYEVPLRCANSAMANLFVVVEVSFVAVLEFAAIRSGLADYRQLITLQLGARKLLIVSLVMLTIFMTSFAFAARGVLKLYEVDGMAKETKGFSSFGRAFNIAFSFAWLAIVLLCRSASSASRLAVHSAPDV
jgi:hypothetical protein